MPRSLEMRDSVHRPTIENIFKRGMRSSDLARTLGFPYSTVKNRLSCTQKRRIVRNDGLSLNKVAGELKIGGRTVQRIVKDNLKLDSYKLARCQNLSDPPKANRLDKAKKLLAHFGVRRDSDVIWSDEKIFTIKPNPNRQNQRQLLRNGENKSPKRRQASNRLFHKSVMTAFEFSGQIKKSYTYEPPCICMQRHFEEKDFNTADEIKTELKGYVYLRPAGFCKNGIHKLPERWKHAVEHDDAYC
uniref:Transposase IS30-like HTH domain-containing protein n=1 Tax=Caenorhabditis japonica TaxID=281687 RepID=A0A8R1IA01_CAEJA